MKFIMKVDTRSIFARYGYTLSQYGASFNEEATMVEGNLALKLNPALTILDPLAKDPLESNGWIRESLGQYRSNGQIKEKTGFRLYTRRRDLNEFIDDFSKKSSFPKPENPDSTRVFDTGSNPPMGDPKFNLTPTDEI